jgi:hypothetical protein
LDPERQEDIGFPESLGCYIFRHFQMNRSRLSGFGNLERLSYHFWNRSRRRDHTIPLGNRLEKRLQVDVLVRLGIFTLCGHLPADGDQRSMIQGGIGHAGHQIGRPRTKRG